MTEPTAGTVAGRDGPLGGAEEQYRLLMEAATDYAIFLLDAEGRVATWNAGAERVFGYREPEILGQPVARLFTPEDVARGEPGEELRRAAAEGRTNDDRWHVRKDGTRLWVNGTTTALRDDQGCLRGFAKVARDRTDQQEAAEAIRASERRFRALVERSFDVVALLSADGVIQYVTPGSVHVIGYPPEEFVGRNAFELMHPDDVERVGGLFQQLLREPGISLTAVFQYRHKDGTWRWIEATGLNLITEPAVGAVVVNFHDVTPTKQAEEALREADRRKDEFLAMVAHELRNPLAPIRNALQVMRLRGSDRREAVGWAQDMMERQVRHLVRLVDDLLDISRIGRGKIQLRKEPVELSQVVTLAVETSRPLIDAHRHELTVALPPAPVRLEADRDRLAQVVANLLNNAAKYTESGGRIRLTAAREGAAVVLRVEDNGVGIAPEMLPRVFDPFAQADRSLHRAQGGLGVGLTLVKRLVEMHGGSVAAESAGPGRGSTFTVRLPAGPGSPLPHPAGEAPPRDGLPPSARRLLVVDDNVDAAESLARMLRLTGHEVRTVHEAAAVLDAARAFQPEVVLLDIGLPGGMTGYELAPRLREVPGLRNVLLVALTGYGQDEDRRRSSEVGFDAHLVKPADLAELQRLLTGAPPAPP
jgi:PAS domain S-box-containing protein